MSDSAKYAALVHAYFTGLARQVESSLERELAVNLKDKARVERLSGANTAAYLQEISDCRQTCLSFLNDESFLNELNESQGEFELKRRLFRAFCFLAQFRGLVRVISTDVYVTEEQIALFKSVLASRSVASEDHDEDEMSESDEDERTSLKESTNNDTSNEANKMPSILNHLFEFTTRSVKNSLCFYIKQKN
jgi:hypothetical protein